MPASAEMRADNAQYDDSLRGVLLHTDGPPVAGIRGADDEIIAGGGHARRPEHGAWVVPGAATLFRIAGHFRAVSLSAHSPVSPASDWQSQRQRRLADVGNLSLASPQAGRRACNEGGQ
jgi:hypothetical protein